MRELRPSSPALSRNDAAVPISAVLPRTLGAWGYLLIRTVLSVVFIVSGVSKLFAPKSFVILIEAYGIVPDALLWPVAFILCIAELVAGLGLLLDIRGCLGTIAGLLVLFMIILGYGLWLGLDVDCGCFGPDDPEGRAYHGLRPAFYRDAVMLAGIGFLYFWRYRHAWRPRRLLFALKPIMKSESCEGESQ